MKEKSLRTAHRVIGLPLAVFLILQAATGMLLTIEQIAGYYFDGIVHVIHYNMGVPGEIYRILLGAGLLWMAASGLWIYLKIRARTKKAA